jgi:hypothetical protein
MLGVVLEQRKSLCVLDNSHAQALNYGIPWSAIEGDMQKVLSDRKRGDLLELVAKALPVGSL